MDEMLFAVFKYTKKRRILSKAIFFIDLSLVLLKIFLLNLHVSKLLVLYLRKKIPEIMLIVLLVSDLTLYGSALVF